MLLSLFKAFFWFGTALVSGALLGLSAAYLYFSPSLPSVETLRSMQLQMPLRVLSSDRKLIAEFGEMRREPITYANIPHDFIHALLAAEDDRFEYHQGVDVASLIRAGSELLKTGHIQTGGSTITMQVAKNFFLSSERSFSRKITEILLALQIERELTKDEIFELYVNKIYLGNRAYGIQAAAQVYYGKSISELSLAQMAMIAGLPKAPSRFNPLVNAPRSKERRDWILGRMFKLNFIDEARYQTALAEPIDASYHGAVQELEAPYVAEMVRTEMVGRYGSDAYTRGFSVTTTVQSTLQEAANTALRQGLLEYDMRHGYRGPAGQYPNLNQAALAKLLIEQRVLGGLEPAVVTQVTHDGLLALLRDGTQVAVAWSSMQWARRYLNTNSLGPRPQKPEQVAAVGDLIRLQRSPEGAWLFRQIPGVQGALVSLDPSDGAIRALIGGFSFDQSHYNRVTQAKRQPGSSFKPFIYSAALDKGFTAASIINDAPIAFQEAGMPEVWRPKNDNNTFLGPIPLREALYRSRNIVSIRVLQAIGMDYTLSYLEKFGFNKADLPPNLSLALGTADLTPLEIASGWSVFANGGFKVTPYLISSIEDRDGTLLFTANPARVPATPLSSDVTVGVPGTDTAITPPAITPPAVAPQVVDARTVYILTSMLEDVITRGTGRRALALKRSDLAGKTGTTNESKDSWFSGFNADYVTTVWTGFDQPESLGRLEYGGTVALPIWINYMGVALAGRPEHQLPEPSGITSRRIDPSTGQAASANTIGAYFELFKTEDDLNNLPLGSDPLPQQDQTPIDLF